MEYCGRTAEGMSCIKKTMQFPEGDWDHGGGCVFAEETTLEQLNGHHYDAHAFLGGEPVETHAPEKCPKDDSCWVYRMELPFTAL